MVVGVFGVGSGMFVMGVVGDIYDCGFCIVRERRLVNCFVVLRGGMG